MEQSELNQILDQHRLWLETNGVQGKLANLEGADLRGADLRGADLRGADLRGADLRGADLTHANLTHANLTHANLTHANLRGANLTGADLTDANLTGATLTGADLTGANLNGAFLRDADLTGAILPDISWIIPGCLAQLNQIKYDFYLKKEFKYENFVQDSLGFIIENNPAEGTFDILVKDRVIRGIPHWVKYSGLKQIASESV